MDNTSTNTKTHNGGFLTLATYDPNDKKIIYYKTECKGVRKKAKPIEAEKKVQSFTSNVILEFKKKDVRIGLSQAACFSKSSSYHSTSPIEVIKFIRNNSVNGKAPIYITTNIDDSGKCNVYKFADFPAYVNDACDELMGTYIRTLQNEKPKGASKGKVLSLSQCGMLDFLTPENIAKVKKIVYSEPDRSRWSELFDRAGVSELIGTVSLLEKFKFTEMPEASISLTTYRKMLNSLEFIYNRDYFYLKRLLEVAKENQEILLKLSLVSQLVFNKPLSIYTSKSNSMDMPTEFNYNNVIPFEPPYVKEKKMSQCKFERLKKVVGVDNLELLGTKSVLVLGCGGVGGYVVEALARSGIGEVILVDYDVVDETNINRQIIALDSTVGKLKIDLLEERVKDINSNCNVIKIGKFINQDNYLELFNYKIDYFVDCCDTVSVKKLVMKECLENGINFIGSMGTGNKLDPSKLEITDIRKTVNDPLARILRKFVKDEKINKKIMVLSSRELPVKTGDRTPGSTAFVPASAGLLIASYIVREFIKK